MVYIYYTEYMVSLVSICSQQRDHTQLRCVLQVKQAVGALGLVRVGVTWKRVGLEQSWTGEEGVGLRCDRHFLLLLPTCRHAAIYCIDMPIVLSTVRCSLSTVHCPKLATMLWLCLLPAVVVTIVNELLLLQLHCDSGVTTYLSFVHCKPHRCLFYIQRC